MSIVDMVIRNGKIFTPYGLVKAGLAIDEGRIVSIAKDPRLPKADRVIDARGKLIIPGGIDAHVHIYTGEKYRYREDFENGSKAALAGGTTMVIDFVGFAGDPKKEFEEKKEIGEKESSIDFSLHADILNEKSINDIPMLAEKGVSSFKHIMANCDGPEYIMPDGLILESFKKVGEVGGIASVHAENEEIRAYLVKKLKDSGRNDPLAHAESRPRICEDEAVSRAIIFAKEAGVHLHVFHLSSGNAVNFIKWAKSEGYRITCETCPHYLLFTQDDLKRLGPYLQVNPSLKHKSDREALWKALAEGSIDIVTSDHYAPLRSEKENGWENIWEVEAGVPGVETRLMLLMSEGVNKGRISLKRFVDALCTLPAKIFGFYPKKGIIHVGSDADIVIIDHEKEFKISADKLHHRADWTPYEGIKVKGIPILTIVKGKVMMEDGEVWGDPGYGNFIGRKSKKQTCPDIKSL